MPLNGWFETSYISPPSFIPLMIFSLSSLPPSSGCATALCRILTLFTELNIPLAPRKTFRPTQVLDFMGITLDSVLMQARLPEDKLSCAHLLLSSWSSKTFCDLRELNPSLGLCTSVVGKSPRGAPSCGANLTQGVSNPRRCIRINNEFQKDILMWQLFFDNWNGVSLFLPPPPYTIPSPWIHLYTDAMGAIGYGAFFDNRWF